MRQKRSLFRAIRLTAFAWCCTLLTCSVGAEELSAEQNGDFKIRRVFSWEMTGGTGFGRAVGSAKDGRGVPLEPLPDCAAGGSRLKAIGDQHLVLEDSAGRPLAYYHTVTDRWFPAEGCGRERRFGAAAWTVLVAYFVLMALMAAYFARKEKSADDFFRGGQRIPWYVAGMSIFATMLSSVTFIALPAQVYLSDWRYVPMLVSLLVLAPLVIRRYLPFFRRLNVTCAYEYLEMRFNLGTRLFASVAFVVFMVSKIAVVLVLPAIVLNAMTGVSIDACVTVCGVATVIYCALGGFEAVVWSDFVQGLVLIGGTVVILMALIATTDGGVAGFLSLAYGHGKLRVWDFRPLLTEPVLWVVLVAGLSQNLYYLTADQCVVQRYVSVKDERSAGRSIWFNGVVSVAVASLFFLLGSALWTHYRCHPELTDVTMAKPDGILPLFIVTELPGWLAGLVVAAIFAATVSTLSANISSSATAIVSDFVLRFRPKTSGRAQVRWGQGLVIAIGLVGLVAALALVRVETRSLFDNFQDFIAMLTSGLTGLFFVGVFLPRVKGLAALCGLIANYAVCFSLRFCDLPFARPHFLLSGGIGFLTSVSVAWVLSWIVRERMLRKS